MAIPTLQDYLDLIPAPNSIQPNFMAWVGANFELFINGQNVLNSMIAAFNIDNAVGVQLDVIGAILGRARLVDFIPSGGADPVLSDDNYRIVLKAKIIQNLWKGTKEEIYNFWQIFFPTTPVLIVDNQDMSMDVLVIGMAPGIQQELVENGYFVPKPAGVRINYTFSTDPIFAFDYDTDYLKGWDLGEWAPVS